LRTAVLSISQFSLYRNAVKRSKGQRLPEVIWGFTENLRMRVSVFMRGP
jgi:hypothetical protein